MCTSNDSIRSFLQEWIVANSLESTLTINVANQSEVDPLPEQPERKHQIDNYCRLCLCEPSTPIPLQTLMGDVSIADMFTGLTGIPIDPGDPYPKQVCAVCLGKLEKAYEIRKEFLDSVGKLESYFGGGNAVDIKEEEVEIKEEPESDSEPAMPEVDDPGDPSSGAENSSDAAEAAKLDNGSRRRSPTKRLEISDGRSVMDPLLCYVCKTKFNDERELNIHLPKHADMLPYTCESCGSFQEKKITTVVMLHRHFRMHGGTIECPQCPKRFFNRDRLYAHKRRFHARVKFTCEKCGRQLNHKESYQSHMLRHDAVEEGRFKCPICDMKFGNSSRLKRHELIHQKTKEFQCQYCPKSLSSKTLLLTHEREHVDAGDLKQYACAFCDARFSTSCGKSQHVVTKHPESVDQRSNLADDAELPRRNFWKEFKCSFEGCVYVAKCYQSFYNHKNRHLKRFQCPQCQRYFPNGQTLRIHKNAHLDKTEWPHGCDQCGKRFVHLTRLQDHMRLHTGSKPFLCTECGESFSTRQRLANHELKHVPPQHKCQICGKEFRYKGDYVRHVRKHEEETGGEKS